MYLLPILILIPSCFLFMTHSNPPKSFKSRVKMTADELRSSQKANTLDLNINLRDQLRRWRKAYWLRLRYRIQLSERGQNNGKKGNEKETIFPQNKFKINVSFSYDCVVYLRFLLFVVCVCVPNCRCKWLSNLFDFIHQCWAEEDRYIAAIQIHVLIVYIFAIAFSHSHAMLGSNSNKNIHTITIPFPHK